jgi:Kyakuja-Dileera-Zisupton transposase
MMKGITWMLLAYDVFCQWIINLFDWVNQSPFLSILKGLESVGAIGDFHVRGHVNDCLPRYTLAYIPGSGVIDGEILETLWKSTKGATMAHQNEILDDHMNHSNWKKLIGMHKYLTIIPLP